MRKVFLLIFLFMAAQGSQAAQTLKISDIAQNLTFKVQGKILLPVGQKLNKGASSNITVLEKTDGGWQEISKLKLNEVFALTEEIPYSFSVQSYKKDSALKIKASLYHCDKRDGGHCVIDDFEGDLRRARTSSGQNVTLNLKGSSPRPEKP